ncbi:putative ankyrin and het domain-containing protein [Botrytis fragariae]|uniref:Putative ankyrin and het domain-containing protein n=1 Tax=Botrytis fragariae TaxID=1964551 RepID=A0A8H6EE64_9HELO|nr:putative ankyrin and het domain-containing protein [Botrytis fragariae]KAF5868906.1 putative ankyrin and het domain-containing protein [Botrytis fragariae]
MGLREQESHLSYSHQIFILWETICSITFAHLLDILKIIDIIPTSPEDDRAMENSTTRKDHTSSTKPKFRLFHLKSGTGTQQLCATIHVENMDSAAANGYICLSYVWGTEISTEQIKVDENEISIHTSLLTSLRHIRKPHHTLVLSIDALCVDQNNPDEKASQIANIFEMLTCLHMAWSATQSYPYHREYISIDNKHYHELAGYYKANSGRICFGENSKFNDLWDRFLLVANSTWFTHVWTVQGRFYLPILFCATGIGGRFSGRLNSLKGLGKIIRCKITLSIFRTQYERFQN